MRWQFGNASDPVFGANRKSHLAKIEKWWGEFARSAEKLASSFAPQNVNRIDIPAWMREHLGAVHPQLMWEFGPAVKGPGHRLVITPESAHHLRPFTTSLLHRAPQLPGWEFYGYRLPENVEQTHRTVEARTAYNINDFRIRVQRGQFNRVDVCYCGPGISSEEDREAHNAAFVATEVLFGEQLLDQWVGAIEVMPLKKPSVLTALFGRREAEPKHFLTLGRAKETLDAVVQSIRDQLSPEPHLTWDDENSLWHSWELQPVEAEDYPRQSDLVFARTFSPDFWLAAHNETNFFSQRFSRAGEKFCYLKIEGLKDWKDCEFADKLMIEDAVNETLKASGLGCVLGGGVGVRYSYIELALVDLIGGIQAIQNRLRAGKVPKQSWILFHDSDLVAEWVGIYDDSPPPPMPDFDE
jgi:hypothetical protein